MKAMLWLVLVCGLVGGVLGVWRSHRLAERAAAEPNPYARFVQPAPANLHPYNGPILPLPAAGSCEAQGLVTTERGTCNTASNEAFNAQQRARQQAQAIAQATADEIEQRRREGRF